MSIKAVNNPFQPSHPAQPEQLRGREIQISEIEKCLKYAKKGTPHHFLILGDRGIGKTSLLQYARLRAQSGSNEYEENFNYIVVNITLSKRTSQIDLARDISAAISSTLRENNSKITNTLESTWNFLQRLEINGTKISPSPDLFNNQTNIVLKVAEMLTDVSREHCVDGNFDGILILIDEADQCSSELDLGGFIKYTTEILTRSKCTNVIFGLSGLENTAKKLAKSHASSLRIFNIMKIPKLKKNDLLEILSEASLSLLSSDGIEFSVTPEACKEWWEISDGHPHHIQQIGFQAFKCAIYTHNENSNTLEININTLMQSIYEDHGVADIIGYTYCDHAIDLFTNDVTAIRIFRSISTSSEQSASLVQIIDEIGSTHSDKIRTHLRSLHEAEMITEDINDQSYKIKYPLYAYWFSKCFPEKIESQ